MTLINLNNYDSITTEVLEKSSSLGLEQAIKTTIKTRYESGYTDILDLQYSKGSAHKHGPEYSVLVMLGKPKQKELK